MPIKLVIADDHPLVLNGLLQLFETEPDFTVLASCTDGEQTLTALRQYQTDILVLDLNMPRMGGLDVLRQMRREQIVTRVVVLTAALDEDEVIEAIRLGVRGVVLKEMAPLLLLQCLHKVHAGEEWLEKRSVSRALDKMLRRENGRQEISKLLTPREIELLKLVATGLSNDDIARKLFISTGTVKTHVHRIYEKLNLNSRVALTLFAKENDLL